MHGCNQENQVKLFKEVIQFSPGKLQGGGGSGLGLYSTFKHTKLLWNETVNLLHLQHILI